jgi:nucleoside-diphosphate-sugar epimerase
MSRSLFITGATGFVGRRLLERVRPGEFSGLYCLTRSAETPAIKSPASVGIRFIQGDLSQPERFIPYLKSVDAVIHLAARTGKAPPEEYYHVNHDGTRRLVEACIACGVERFLHVSTISVKYPENRNYHYGLSKRQGEDIVTASGLSYVIARPTIVLGKESSAWKNLSSLGRRSPMVIPGDGRAKIQPVHVDDLVDCLLEIIRQNLFIRAICEVGGRDIVSTEEFLRKVHWHYFKRNPMVIRIPLAIILSPLRFADRAFPSLLPVNAGQFAVFQNDGIVENDPTFKRCIPEPKGVDAIIGEILRQEGGTSHTRLEKECKVFSRYLLGRSGNEYVLRKYVEANRVRGLVESAGEDRLGTGLLRVASISPFLTRLTDSFAAIFARRSILRKKLVLLIAILESSRCAGELVGPREGRGSIGTWISLIGNGIAFLASFLFSILLFTPLAILSKLGMSRRPR